jgi:hypothetical protein
MDRPTEFGGGVALAPTLPPPTTALSVELPQASARLDASAVATAPQTQVRRCVLAANIGDRSAVGIRHPVEVVVGGLPHDARAAETAVTSDAREVGGGFTDLRETTQGQAERRVCARAGSEHSVPNRGFEVFKAAVEAACLAAELRAVAPTSDPPPPGLSPQVPLEPGTPAATQQT